MIAEKTPIFAIPVSDAAARMVSTIPIMLVLRLLRKNNYWTSFVMGSICKTSCGGVWKNLIPGYKRSSHYVVGMTTMKLHDTSSTFTNIFVILLHKGACYQIFLDSSSWMILHPLWVFSLWSINCFPYSEIFIHNHCRWCDQGLFGVFFSLFCITLIIPSFTTLRKQKLVGETLRIGLPIRVIIRLVI